MIEQLIQAWTFKEIQTAVVMYGWLKDNGFSMEDLKSFVEKDMKRKSNRFRLEQKRQKAALEATPKCEKCEGTMRLKPGEDETNCYWECRKCAWSRFVDHSFKQEREAFQKRMEEIFNGLSNDESRDFVPTP